MKTIRYMLTEVVFVWMLIKFKMEEVQRQAYRIVPRYPMKMSEVKRPNLKPPLHPLDDPRVLSQRHEWN